MTIEERAKQIANEFKHQTYFDDRCNNLAANIAYQSAIICLSEKGKIDENKLDTLAKQNRPSVYEEDDDWIIPFEYGFKLGYRKAKEE